MIHAYNTSGGLPGLAAFDVAAFPVQGLPARQVRPVRSVAKALRSEERRARILDEAQIERVLSYVAETSTSPLSAELKILLSFYAGLRAAEIASLSISAMCDADGRIGRVIRITAKNSKSKRARNIPMHPLIHAALQRFRQRHPNIDFVAFTGRFGNIRRQSAAAVTTWFHRLYRDMRFEGCSSHSGRRTFITNLARCANEFGNSLRDVQQLAGHARLDTTERYIDPSHDVAALVSSLGGHGRPATQVRRKSAPDISYLN
jgi:integrase